MSGQDSVTAPEDGPPDAARGAPKLFTGASALVWSASVAVLTGFATCVGMVRESGKFAALGLYSLAPPAISQRDTFRGMSSLLDAILLVMVAAVTSWIIFWFLRKIPIYWLTNRFPSNVRCRLWWCVVVCIVVDVIFLNASIIGLAKRADGIILKHLSEVGPVWQSVLLDEDRGAEFGYDLIWGEGLALLVFGSWWVVDQKMKSRWSKIAFATWAVAQTLGLLLGYSFLSGVTDTNDKFPAVAFSGEEQLQKGAMAILLGSDDKGFALLVINTQSKSEDLQKYILYLPRAEVKWITVLRLMPLHPLANLEELKGNGVTAIQ